ncbi:hypothetical protein AB9P05_19895 [Roseivirga sp. BDSF3-8]|uniref:hypothetical protein n=1 Tax=Roseivirga sp. BDSF3-8 TaxID=3241598 RepID=UPI003531CDCF
MTLDGNYYSSDKKYVLKISDANNKSGTADGTIETDHVLIPIKIQYLVNDQLTNLQFSGQLDSSDKFIGGSGSTDSETYKKIKLAYGFTDGGEVKPYKMDFKRQD